MSGTLDQRLLEHWKQSQRRQKTARRVLERSSIEPDRFEGWALDLIGEAFTGRSSERNGSATAAAIKPDLAFDDR